MEIDIREYLEPLRKWWWLILLSTAVAGVSSYLATLQQVALYRSTTTLMIGSAIENPNPSDADLFITQRLARTYVDIANRAFIRDATMEALGLKQLPDIFVRNINNTNFIEITVTDISPERAQAVAAEMSRQLILSSPTEQENDRERQAFIDEQLDAYETAITETQAQIDEKRKEIGELISAHEIADMQADIANLQSSLQALQSNFAALLPSSQRGATNTIREIEPAFLPRQPINQNSRTTIVIAAAIGFILASSAAYLMEYLDDTVGTYEMAARITGVPTLAGIPKFSSEDEPLIAYSEPRSPVSEAYRILRTAVQFSNVTAPSEVLLVTSAVPDEGKSMTAANLAIVMAQAGNNVLLVDTDLRRPYLHQLFKLPNRQGLTSILLEYNRKNADGEIKTLVEETIQATRVGRLQVLSSGPVPPNPSELLGSPDMANLLEMLEEQFDLVILDSPPVLAVTDAAVLSTRVDTTLLVIRFGKSKKDMVKRTVERLREVNASVLGCVMNAISPDSSGYYVYDYYEEYTADADLGSEETEEEEPTGKLRKRFWRKQVA